MDNFTFNVDNPPIFSELSTFKFISLILYGKAGLIQPIPNNVNQICTSFVNIRSKYFYHFTNFNNAPYFVRICGYYTLRTLDCALCYLHGETHLKYIRNVSRETFVRSCNRRLIVSRETSPTQPINAIKCYCFT